MENMQDILKKYYASGGKDLFKEQDDPNVLSEPHQLSNGPTYSLNDFGPLVEKVKDRWYSEVSDDSQLVVQDKVVNVRQFSDAISSVRFRNYKSGEDFDDSVSFMMELCFYKYFPDYNEFSSFIPGTKKSARGKIEFGEPCIQLVAVSSGVELFDAMLIIKMFRDFMQRDHESRRLPKQYGVVSFSDGTRENTPSQGKGKIEVIKAVKKLGMPIVK